MTADRRIAGTIRYVAEELVVVGLDEAEVRSRATLAYTSYLGCSTMLRSTPGALPQGERAAAFVDSLMRLLTS